MQKLHIFNRIYLVLKSNTFKTQAFSAPSVFWQVLAGCFFIFMVPRNVAAQQKTKIILQGSEKSRTMVKQDITYLRKPIFRQDNAILTCDSAVFYSAKNYFEAYDNVHINQADTINIYSDRLTYDGNAKLAHLTSNVRLQDRTSTLTTNTLDYSMGPKVGTYIDGGKILNKDATITSKNGYYFANTRDAYFRYNVLVVTDQSTIKSDTLRYNTLTNWAYFYGPTNIKEKDGNLYTENGAYNTKTTYAYFGKNNLYTSGSRSLKGDSLYYDGIAGYGKAVRNIVFRDTVDKMLMHGQLGFYYKKDQRTLVTKNAYAGLGTTDSILIKDKKVPDSLWLGADTLETQMVLQKSLKLLAGPVIKKDNELGEEVRDKSVGLKKEKAGAAQNTGDKEGKQDGPPVNKSANPLKGDKKRPAKGGDKNKPKEDLKKPTIAAVKDSVVTPVLPPWEDKISRKPEESLLKDSVSKQVKLTPDSIKSALSKIDSLKSKPDSLQLKSGVLKAKTDPIKSLTNPKAKTIAKSGVKAGKNINPKDSLPVNPMDTVLTRTIKAYHHVNVFKTNMQAKADSLFYTSADSTLRWYSNPIMWAQSSQLTGDTIYLQLRNKKINSVQVIKNSFAVNVENDSAKFNQVKGKLITGFFKDGKLNTMYVDGNAETVYFTKKDDGKSYDKMNQTISSRIKILFKNSDISEVVPIKDVEGLNKPIEEVTEDVILTGFIWKPELRPRSKKDITNPKARPIAKKGTAKPVVKAKPGTAKKPFSIKDMKSPAGLAKQLMNKVDSLAKPGNIPQSVIDTAIKAMPGVLKKIDSVTKQPVLLKKQ